MKTVLIAIMVLLILVIGLMLQRVIKGPSVLDRMNGVGIIGADIILLIVLFGYIDGRPDMYVDIAISYAILRVRWLCRNCKNIWEGENSNGNPRNHCFNFFGSRAVFPHSFRSRHAPPAGLFIRGCMRPATAKRSASC